MADHGDEYRPLWRVTCDAGLVARKGQRPTSQKLPGRLPVGTIVAEEMRSGDRLNFTNLSDVGPQSGWVSVGRGLLEKIVESDDAEVFPATIPNGPTPAAPEREDLAVQGDKPLGGWAALATLYGREDQLQPGQAQPLVACAETGRRRAARAELPPVEDLETLDEAALVSVLAFDDMAARHFAKLPLPQKRKMIAEAKALIEMSPERLQEAMEKYRKAWPRGPFPEHSAPLDDTFVLPPGTCFPYLRHLRLAPDASTPEWGLESVAGGAACGSFGKRGAMASPEAQKEFLRSLRCDVACTGGDVSAGPGVSTPEAWQVDGYADIERISGLITSKTSVHPDDILKYFNSELKRRVCFLDGDMPTRLQQEQLEEADYRGERFKNFKETDSAGKPVSLKGNQEMLVLSKPGLIVDIHKEFLASGSDIIRTNTLGCNALTQRKYRAEKLVYEMSKSAAQLAKRATAEVTKQDQKRPRFVAGVIGPTPYMMSLSRGVSWSNMVEAYEEQIKGLVEGGADILMLDGATDSLNAKAAIFAVEAHFERVCRSRAPLIISACVGEDGRTPSGQSAEAFCISVKHARALAVGLCSSATSQQMQQHYKAFTDLARGWCLACPGVGGEEPAAFAEKLLGYAQDGLLNFIGGASGAMPAHMAALREKLADVGVRSLASTVEAPCLQLAGLDACVVKPEESFQIVGSQCTTMGSARFKEKVGAYKATGKAKFLAEALQLSAHQCEKGADILDFNLDSDAGGGPAVPAKGALAACLGMFASDPKAAKVPVMISSCDWETIKEGLKCVQGRGIVNGLTLTLGEEEFLRIAKEVKRLGAALVVLAITENGEPATSVDDRVRICQRSYRVLRYKLDFPPEDIIFDCQVLLLGSIEHAANAVSFIKAVGELKRTCPHASFIGGVNNLSLPFRGLNPLRDALHSVFLQQAIPKGLNLALAWPGALPICTEIEGEMRTLCEELVQNSSIDGRHLERFIAYARFRADSLTCLPLRLPGLVGKHAGNNDTAGWLKSRSVRKEAAETQGLLRSQRVASTPEQQKEFLSRLRCSVNCTASVTKANADVGLPDLCRTIGVVDKVRLSSAVVAKGGINPAEVAKYLNNELRRRVCAVALPHSPKQMGEAQYLEYFESGCDVCGTNTLENASYGECKTAARLAKDASADATRKDPDRPRFVVGILGPTRHSLSAPDGSGDPSARSATWAALVASYAEQIKGLVEGGVDLLAIEAVSDTLNAKAAIFAVDEYFGQTGKERLPLLINVVVMDDGKTLSGQSVEAFLICMRHAKPFAVGVAGTGAGLRSAAKVLASHCHCWSLASASAKEAEEDAAVFAALDCASSGLVNFVASSGLAVTRVAAAKVPVPPSLRPLPALPLSSTMQLAGLEAFRASPEGGVTLVGQRCNTEGSGKFKGLIDAYKYTKTGNAWQAAVEVCVEQCAAGADLLDFNFDSELIDSRSSMGKFLRLCVAQPSVARVPFVLSSSKWSTIEEGLQSVPGKSIVNAISLAQGEEEFLRLAKSCLRYGAAVVVVTVEALDEVPAFAGKVSAGQKAYKLLRTRLDFPAEDIIFDCGVPPVNSNESVKGYVDAVAELKRTCPSASFLGGVGNVSLAFRDAHPLREAMHSMLLYHAVPVGLNIAIVDAGHLPRFDDIEGRTRKLCEEAILDKSEDGGHLKRLMSYAGYLSGGAVEEESVLAAEEQFDIPLLMMAPRRSTPGFTQPMDALVQATGTLTANVFQAFGSKAHAAMRFHTVTSGCCCLKKSVWFSSISAWMGQGGSGAITGASHIMDDLAIHERHMFLGNVATTVEWGAVGEIGLRRTLYGSRDVFAQFDLGQKLISALDTQRLMKIVCVGEQDPYEIVGMAYLDQTWQMTLAGVQAGSALAGRADGTNKTFADL